MVFVDDMRAPYRGMVMCHMIADSRTELDAMADKIGVARKWIQYADTPREHYDISLSMRVKAVRNGAAEITLVELAKKIRARAQNQLVPK